MKTLNLLLVLTLLLSSAPSMAQLPSQPRGLRSLASSLKEAFGRLLAPHWRGTLVSAVAASSLLLSSSAAAQEKAPVPLRPIGHYTQATRAEHQSAFNIALNLADTWRDSHIVYVGRDNEKRALFLSMRINVTVPPVAEAETMLDVSEAWLFNHEGLVQRNAKVEEAQVFLRPDAEFNRMHDLTLLAVEGLDTQDYHAVQVDASLPLETPLDIIAYRFDLALIRGVEGWVDLYSKAPLARDECRAFSVTPELWSAQSNCFDGVMEFTTAPIFTKAGELVGFYFMQGEVVVIPPAVQLYLEEALAIPPEQKLPVTWGELKEEAY